jgi:hypothetical protein
MKYFFILGGILGIVAGAYFLINSIIDITVKKATQEIKKLLAQHR